MILETICVVCFSGIVNGSLLLTPKVLMFNPSLNDPLVQENDPDAYQLVTPAELIVNFAILKDFVKFKTKEETEVQSLSCTSKVFSVVQNVVFFFQVDESLIYKPAETPAAAASGTADKLKGIFKLSAGSSSSPACDTSKDSDGAATAGEPMYFRLLMGKPIAKKLPRTAPIISYGEQSLEAQYWFITTPAKASQLYSFIKENFIEDHRYAIAL